MWLCMTAPRSLSVDAIRIRAPRARRPQQPCPARWPRTTTRARTAPRQLPDAVAHEAAARAAARRATMSRTRPRPYPETAGEQAALGRGRDIPVTDDASLAGRLRALREAAGLSQEELAERAGLSSHAISALERGTRTRPYPHTVRALCDALGADADARAALIAAVPARTRSTRPVTPPPPRGRCPCRPPPCWDATKTWPG